jgi:hypothetical protein
MIRTSERRQNSEKIKFADIFPVLREFVHGSVPDAGWAKAAAAV